METLKLKLFVSGISIPNKFNPKIQCPVQIYSIYSFWLVRAQWLSSSEICFISQKLYMKIFWSMNLIKNAKHEIDLNICFELRIRLTVCKCRLLFLIYGNWFFFNRSQMWMILFMLIDNKLQILKYCFLEYWAKSWHNIFT